MSAQFTPSELKRFQDLMMMAVDGEISAEERLQLGKFVESSPECRKEFEQYRKLKEVTSDMNLQGPSEELWDRYWVSIYNRLERGIAWILFSVGCMILLTYGGFKFVEAIIAEPNLETVLKVGVLLVVAGLAVLAVSVIREKVILSLRDPYRKVQR